MILVRAIKTKKPFKQAEFRKELIAEAHELGLFVQKDFYKTTRTWQHQPVFKIEVKSGMARGVQLSVTTTDDIYKYIDEGTRVRYATMTPGFVPKTRTGIIKSFKGRGGMLFVSKKHPRPGIKARKFTETLVERWKPGFKRGIQNALDRAALRSGHGI